MEDFFNYFSFQILPYIALATIILGSILRFDRDPYSWRTKSSQLLRRKQLIIGSVMFHVGILVVLLGHLAGLFTPIAVIEFLGISLSFKQWVAVVVGGVAGTISWIGLSILIHRRLFDERIRKNSSFADIGIVVLLWMQLTLGMATIPFTLGHMDGSVMKLFMQWAQHIVTFRGDAWEFIKDVHPVYKAHINLGFLIFILFPFTRLVHMFSAPVSFVARPYQIVRKRAT
jgi:nitrate reductase gamma subunit